MTDMLNEPLLDFAPNDARAGFRLHRFEIFNWGTFDQRVWILEPRGENSLVTGDIGSGKSTLVDAITTLLVPANRIIYNKAAGAESRERTLRTYVLGHYKSERGEAGLSARAVALRDNNSYSVVLGHFYNEGYDRHVTLAQVFWMRDVQGQPARFYVVADRSLSIAADFARFGTDINGLRKRLRADRDIELHDTFPPYGAAFRRRFGIDNEQALDLFNQTVSLKSVGNLTEFVRGHMLEAFDVTPRIQALIAHFDDLDRAHQAVLKAKAQLAALEPLVADADRYAELTAAVEELRGCRDALRPWFAGIKAALLADRIARLDAEIARYTSKVEQLTEQRSNARLERDEILRQINDNGGDRIERLNKDIAGLRQQQGERQRRSATYDAVARHLGMLQARDEAAFHANEDDAKQQLAAIEPDEARIQNLLTDASVELHGLEERRSEIETELVSLRSRRSNIPAQLLGLREQLCSSLSLTADTIPFIGELLQVREAERDWEGAIERVLHGFGLSLLVPTAHYPLVAEWVDRTHLRGRLIYYRVLDRRDREPPSPGPDSLVRKVAIRSDSVFRDWVERELAFRFDYACCSTIEQFRRERRAITRAGQIRSENERHEKDDRHSIDDRTRYVLGWTNESKIAAVEKQAEDLGRRITASRAHRDDAQSRYRQLRQREGHLGELIAFDHFRDIDWRSLTADIHRLDAERLELESSSDVLRTLRDQLVGAEKRLKDVETDLDDTTSKRAVDANKRSDAVAMLGDLRVLLDAMPEDARTRYFPLLETMRLEALGELRITVESCDNRQSDMREWLQRRIDAEEKRSARLRDGIIDAMRRYNDAWPIETAEVDVSTEAIHEYRGMLESLKADDLPRFERRFKDLLNENTIREVANFQAQLNRERQEIHARIETINLSLRQIDYNPNRYICLLAEQAQDIDIREFRESLRACTEGAITGSDDEQYSEAKFLQVKAIIERFRGRDGQTDLDQRWTNKVTDVRNWFGFSASERWREDDTEYEHYTDSGGKSGGQKEKLAYTVLAASLAYQFGLEWGEQKSRSFRFVVIDEAFGRGSDDSARFGLELFRRLNLQLLIVTPLQKIHVIEPYVANVGFVHNEDGRRSQMRNLSIEDYRAEREARRLIRIS